MSKLRKLYVVESFERRKRSNVGKVFSVGMVIEENGNNVLPCYVNNEFVGSEVETRLSSLGVGAKVFVTHVFSGGNSFRVTEKSKVMTNVADFQVNMEIVEEFISPKVVSLLEARGSPKKRRLSVRGCVMELGKLSEADSYKRRMLKLGNNSDGCVDIVLWGEAAVRASDLASNEVTVSAVIVDDREQLRSTPSTKFEFGGLNSIEGVVVALGDESDGYPVDMILESNEVFKIPENLEFDLSIALPCGIKFSADSFGVVTEIEIL